MNVSILQIQSSPKIRYLTTMAWQFGFTATGNLGRSYTTPFFQIMLLVSNEKKNFIDHHWP